jgi:ABC-type multidrug transport system ATPase subunit
VIGVAGEFAAVDPNLTGRENLVLIGRLCRLGRRPAARRAVELLEGFGLADAGGRLVQTYSGGMRRRLDLAAALVARPAVVFLDEPTTGLDPEGRRWLWAAVGDLVGDGTTVLLTTQYLEEADAACDEVVVIDAGRVVAIGPPAILKATTGASVVELGYASPAGAESATDSLRLAGWAPDAEGASLRVATVGSSGDAATILRALPADALPCSVSIREATLDDAFLALTATAPNGPPAPPMPVGRTRGRR